MAGDLKCDSCGAVFDYKKRPLVWHIQIQSGTRTPVSVATSYVVANWGSFASKDLYCCLECATTHTAIRSTEALLEGKVVVPFKAYMDEELPETELEMLGCPTCGNGEPERVGVNVTVAPTCPTCGGQI